MRHQCINPPELFKSTPFGFSQIVVAAPGKLVFCSGQVGWDENCNIIGKDNLQLQTNKAFENVKIAVAAAGGSIADVVLLRLYIVRNDPEKAAIVGQALRQYFGTENPPASTWISVDGLASPDFLIEIEAQAVVS